ncbi:ATP-dependent helicase [Candidatus Dojkabacteria bacterium]|nr:ATP-dependent helicase [Candidatus Dojkabacteria bacterium]
MFQTLNSKQQQAVETIEGPVMLLAGPGAGKTHTLTARIANILKNTDANPENILAITFTENASTNMRNRLKEYIGQAAYKVKFATFHAFCNEIIQSYPEKFDLGSNSDQISDLNRVRLIEEIIDELKPQQLTTFSDQYFYKNDILSTVSELKKEGFTPEEFLELVNEEEETLKKMAKTNPKTNKPYGNYIKLEKKIAKNREFFEIYNKYQNELKEQDRYDYDDMILFVVEKLEDDNELLSDLQERFLYILVDEFQDTNGAQTRLLELIGSFDKQPNLFVVGDDDQSIFRFQGANIENIFDFTQNYPDTQIISLDITYRCPQAILDGARSLILKNKNSIENKIKAISKDLKSTNTLKTKININELETSDEENLFILSEIKKLIDSGIAPSDIAIIYRNHKDAEEIKRLFLKSEIPSNIADKGNSLNDLAVIQFLHLLEVVKDPYNDKLLFEILNFDFLDIKRLKVLKAVRNLNNNKLFDVLNESTEKDSKLADFLNKLLEWGSLDHNASIISLSETILNESGLLDYLQKSKNYEGIEALKSLFKFILNQSSGSFDYKLENLLSDIDGLNINRISLNLDYTKEGTGVNFLTAHKAKGLEFDYVFIMNLRDGVWGNKRTRRLIKLPDGIFDSIEISRLDENEEERRLLYVAMTRAKKQLNMSFSTKSIENGKERNYIESQFIGEIDEDFCTREKGMFDEKLYDLVLEQIPALNFDDNANSYLKNLVNEFKLSITALNNYLEDPRRFFLENLLRVPSEKPEVMILGSVIHKLLEKDNLEPEYYKKLISNELKRESLSKDISDKIFKEAVDIFEGFIPEIQANKAETAHVEYNFHSHNVFLDDIELTGKIDKIEWIDKQAKTVRLIDYKTSTPKSRNQILGLTKYSDEKLLRQLQFYKLISQLDSRFEYNIAEFELRFVKPDPAGNYRSQIFTADEIETVELKEVIKETMEKIRNLEF